MRPSASTMRAPFPSRGWNDVRAYVGRMNALSRDSTAAGDSSCSNNSGSSTNVDERHSGRERTEGGLQLRLHPAADDLARQQRVRVVRRDRREDAAVLVE